MKHSRNSGFSWVGYRGEIHLKFKNKYFIEQIIILNIKKILDL